MQNEREISFFSKYKKREYIITLVFYHKGKKQHTSEEQKCDILLSRGL